MSSSSSDLPIQVAARLLAQGRPAAAAARLAEITRETPTYAAAHVLHATALESAGDPEAALDAWGRAAVLVPLSPLVYRERGRLMAALWVPDAEDEELPPAVPASVEEGDEIDVDEDALDGDAELDALIDALTKLDAPEAEDDESGPFPDEGNADADAASAPDSQDDLAEEDPDAADADLDADDVDVAELLPPEESDPDPVDVVPEAVDEAADDGWDVLTEEPVPSPPPDPRVEPDVIAPEPPPGAPEPTYVVADELDALISQLEDAPRIKPDPAFQGPSVSFDAGDMSEMYSETLAEIYAAQHQYVEAAVVYEKLAQRNPEAAEEMLRKAAALRERG